MLENRIYDIRFSERELSAASGIWAPLCRYLQRYVPPDGAVLDLGAGYCHFVNRIRAATKIAVDLHAGNLDRHAAPSVRKVVSDGAEIAGVEADSVDTVFASNVYEHFRSREDVARSFGRVLEILRPRGRLIVLQPNFRYCFRRYFDFFDHRLEFTHHGMVEGLVMAGFEIERVTPRFLPYTSKSRLPKSEWLVSLYLALPPAWWILGQQMLVVARKPGAGGR